MSAGVAPTEATRVVGSIASRVVPMLDAINIALMVATAVLAWLVPVELFASSYVVLGPLHYLTQLAWLRDRRWFTAGRFDPLVLALPVALLAFGRQIDPLVQSDWRTPVVFAILLAAVILVVVSQWRIRAILFAAATLLAWSLRRDPALVLLALMLPSAIHIFLFTGGFILTGALRNRSGVGVVSFSIFVATAALLLFYPSPEANHVAAPIFARALVPFAMIRERLGLLFGFAPDRFIGVDRFLGWAYCYHYLNWFSKTRLIGWHRGTSTRLASIALAWMTCVALYAIDYSVGFMVVGLVAMLHVVLELPLDVRTFAGLPLVVVRAVRPAAIR
ncbi:MAG: hypothetical protein HY270_23630 [Deltaproteobacteria bacterium]|nr:hypothetical protein [Deltaproteobacteria bacterium]